LSEALVLERSLCRRFTASRLCGLARSSRSGDRGLQRERPVQLHERLGRETDALHAEAEAELITLRGLATSADYRRFVERTFGFVAPLEQSLWATPGLDRLVDMRRFRKHVMLRADLQGFGLKHDEIDALPCCEVPCFESPDIALGWAYIVERSALAHVSLFRHLASVMPGAVAYTATYLRAHQGAAGEHWRRFVAAIDAVATDADKADALITAAKVAFRARRRWRDVYEQHTIGGRRERVA
jgi:heme oxygenase (biliverdin-IX-beta and delta-forming)